MPPGKFVRELDLEPRLFSLCRTRPQSWGGSGYICSLGGNSGGIKSKDSKMSKVLNVGGLENMGSLC